MFLKRSLIILLPLSLFSVFGCSKSEPEQKETESMTSPVISGYLYGADGAAMQHAIVAVEPLSSATKEEPILNSVSENGEYSLNLIKQQRYLITYLGVTHLPMSLVVNYTGQKNLKMNVELDRIPYLDEPTKVKVTIYKNDDDDAKPESHPMAMGEDGHFNANIDLPSGNIKYRLSGLAEGSYRVVNSLSKDFEFGPNDNFYSIDEHQGGIWTIDYKPQVSEQNKATSPLTLSGNWQKQDTSLQLQAKFYRLLIAQRIATVKAKDADFVYQDGLDELIAWHSLYKDPELQDLILMMSTRLIGQLPKVHNSAINKVDVKSWLWDLPYVSFARSLTSSGEPISSEEENITTIRQLELYKKLSDKYLKVSFNDDEKAKLLLYLADSYRGNNEIEKYNYYFDQLKNDYSHVESFDFYKKILSPSKLVKGMEAPAFSIAELQDESILYTKESFPGKVYLLDFWATWCPPCLKEMPNLHNTYANYKDKGFEILSLSADSYASDVVKYRKGKWPMPWKHAFLDDRKHPILNAYFIFGFPTTFLIDEHGKILASGIKVRGTELDKTLDEYYENKKSM